MCGSHFTLQSARVTDTTIHLHFTEKVIDGAACIPEAVHGTTFRLEGLKAGTYRVMAVRHAPCTIEPCLEVVHPEPAGTLTVTNTTSLRGAREGRSGRSASPSARRGSVAFPASGPPEDFRRFDSRGRLIGMPRENGSLPVRSPPLP